MSENEVRIWFTDSVLVDWSLVCEALTIGLGPLLESGEWSVEDWHHPSDNFYDQSYTPLMVASCATSEAGYVRIKNLSSQKIHTIGRSDLTMVLVRLAESNLDAFKRLVAGGCPEVGNFCEDLTRYALDEGRPRPGVRRNSRIFLHEGSD